jgi:hypothetical protein
MNKEIITSELQWLLDAINEQFEAIREHTEKTPRIEFDILLENVRKFYDDLHKLRRINDPSLVPAPRRTREQETPPAPPVPEVPKPAPRPAVVQAGAVSISYADPVQPVYAPDPLKEEIIPPVVPAPVAMTSMDEPPVIPNTQPKPIPPRKPAKQPEPDLFAAEEPDFSLKLKEARERTFSPRIPSGRVDNLKSAITINEKFMFINELFDGNLREYNETIETLNGFTTLDQAADYLDLMKKKNFWDTGSNAFRKLRELVERRF